MPLTLTVEVGPGMLSDIMRECAELARRTGCTIEFTGNERLFRVHASGRDGYSCDPTGGVGSIELWEPLPNGRWEKRESQPFTVKNP
jgi:hypothetical protein